MKKTFLILFWWWSDSGISGPYLTTDDGRVLKTDDGKVLTP